MSEQSEETQVVYWPRVKEILDGIMARWIARWIACWIARWMAQVLISAETFGAFGKTVDFS